MKYLPEVPRETFTDAHLTPRARRMAEWLCDLANDAMPAPMRSASAEMLLRELPDHWTADDLVAEARQAREILGARQPRTAWLGRMGWLVGEEERLPAPAPRPMLPRAKIARVLAETLGQMRRVS